MVAAHYKSSYAKRKRESTASGVGRLVALVPAHALVLAPVQLHEK